MADNILFKSGLASKLNDITKTAGQLLFAIDGTSGSIYLDKDSTTRIKMNLDATKLQNARAINGTPFDGTQNITTTKWGSKRTITVSDNDGTNIQSNANIDGSANFTLKLPATIKATLSGKASTAGHADTASSATTATTCTGNAATATALTSNAGSSTVPVYFSNGKPVACDSLWTNSSTSSTSEFQVGARSAAGSIYLYSTGSKTGNRGIWGHNNDGADVPIITVNSSNDITLNGNASTATKLSTTRNIFGRPFDGTADVVGRALMYGDYSSDINNHAFTAALEIRENGLVGVDQTDIKYAPEIGFHWAGHCSGGLALGSDTKFRFLASNGSPATLIANLEGNASSASWLNANSSLTYGANGFQYFNLSGTQGTSPSSNNTPTSNWYHIMRLNHANSSGCFADIAVPLNDTAGIWWRQIRYGTNYGWYKILDSNNYTNYTVTKTGSGASGTWGINITGNADTVDNYHAANLLRSDGGVWNEGANIVCTGTGEWSFDITDTSSTPGGACWHVWSGNTGSSILACYPADGRVIIPAHLSVGGYDNRTYSLSTNSFICNSWIRTVGYSGWYNETYGGGLFMDDSTWVKVYNNKKLFVSNTDLDAICTRGGVIASYLKIDNTNSSGYVELGEDGEGGTIRLIGPNGSKWWEIDCWNSSDLRIFSHDGSNYQFFVFGGNGTLSAPRFSGNWNGNTIGIDRGGTGVTSLNDLRKLFREWAPIDSSNDTTYNWGVRGLSVAGYGYENTITDKPSTWGIVLNMNANDTELHQLWFTQPSGRIFHRSGNGSGWSGSWRLVYSDGDSIIYSSSEPTDRVKGTIWLQPI